jgi:hypothetical protein
MYPGGARSKTQEINVYLKIVDIPHGPGNQPTNPYNWVADINLEKV